jgi:hypothetical protein
MVADRHAPHGLAAAEGRAEDVDGVERRDRVRRHPLDRVAAAVDAGIVDQAREAARPAPLVHLREERDEVGLFGNVASQRERLPAAVGDLARDGLGPRPVRAVVDDHRVPPLRRQPGGRRADAARASGDDDGSPHAADANRRQPRPGSAPPFTWITCAVTCAAPGDAR